MNEENKEIVVPIGIPLRDWYAGQTLVGTLANVSNFSNANSPEKMAKFCYVQADALLKAREQNNKD